MARGIGANMMARGGVGVRRWVGKQIDGEFGKGKSGGLQNEGTAFLYDPILRIVDDAAKRLRGFERIALAAGEQKEVEICVPADDLKLWDSDAHAFAFKGKKAKVQIGASSADIRLKKNVKF